MNKTIYQSSEFKNRKDYLDYLVMDFWIELETVKKLADQFTDNDAEGMFTKLPRLIEKELDNRRKTKK